MAEPAKKLDIGNTGSNVATLHAAAANLGEETSFPLNETFGFQGVFDASFAVKGYAKPSVFTPREVVGFPHDPDFIRFMLIARRNKLAAYVHGLHGSRKTESILQFCRALNLPVQVIQCHRDTMVDDMIGQMLPHPAGGAYWVDGPLTLAARYGHVLFVNERPMLKPGVAAFLNNVLEGRALVLNANGGEIVPLHPNFWVVADGNTIAGDMTGDYSGQYKENRATASRYVFFAMHQQPEDLEISVLSSAVSEAPVDTVKQVVQFARAVRSLNEGAKLEATLSMREMIQWMRFMVDGQRFGIATDPLEYGFRHAHFVAQSYEDRVSLADKYRLVFSREIDPGVRPSDGGSNV
jgi:cobaltochelatase CobS